MEKSKIINLFGLSGSGKTTVEQMLKITDGFHKVTSCATRSIRDGEAEGEDYYFISDDEFNKLKHRDKFAEVGGKYGGRYGVLWSEIFNNRINVLVTAKDGIDELIKLDKFEMINVWLDCDICERFIRIGKRNNLEYSLGRIEKDGFRRGLEIDNADYVIDTTKMTQSEMFEATVKILKYEGWLGNE